MFRTQQLADLVQHILWLALQLWSQRKSPEGSFVGMKHHAK